MTNDNTNNESKTMTAKQNKITNELKAAFDNAETFSIVGPSRQNGPVKVFVSFVTRDCTARKSNQFEVGPRGGLKVIKQEFTSND